MGTAPRVYIVFALMLPQTYFQSGEKLWRWLARKGIRGKFMVPPVMGGARCVAWGTSAIWTRPAAAGQHMERIRLCGPTDVGVPSPGVLLLLKAGSAVLRPQVGGWVGMCVCECVCLNMRPTQHPLSPAGGSALSLQSQTSEAAPEGTGSVCQSSGSKQVLAKGKGARHQGWTPGQGSLLCLPQT